MRRAWFVVLVVVLTGCAWWAQNEPVIVPAIDVACLAAAAAACLDPVEAYAVCSAVERAADYSVTFADTYCRLIDGGADARGAGGAASVIERAVLVRSDGGAR